MFAQPAVFRTHALVLGLSLACGVASGCGSGRAQRLRPTHVERVANGRPDTCPERAVDPFGDGTPAPDDLRCSYADAPGGSVVALRGHVVTGTEGAQLGMPVSGAELVVYTMHDGGPQRIVARGRADTQGSFTIGAMLAAGEYGVGVAGAPETVRRFRVGDADPPSILIIVPRR